MVEIVVSPNPAILQQHGFVHGGVVSAIADSAAGYAALSLMPADTGVLTTEFKINFLAPAAGERILPVDAWLTLTERSLWPMRRCSAKPGDRKSYSPC